MGKPRRQAHHRTRPGRVVAVLRRSALAAIAAIAFAAVGCSGGEARVANVEFRGARYSGGTATGLDINAADVAAIGSATRIQAQVEGDTVFALSGVSPDEVIVMNSATPESAFSIFFRDGVGQ